MIIMSVDFGDVRTGIAVCDKMQILASPVCVITEKDKEKLTKLYHQGYNPCLRIRIKPFLLPLGLFHVSSGN